MPVKRSLWQRIIGRTQIGTIDMSANRYNSGEPAFVKGGIPIPLIPTAINRRAYWSTWSTEDAVTNGYAASVFVYACVNKLMKAAASVPWRVKVRSGDSYETDDDHPIAKLFRRPNQFATFQNQIETITSHLFLGGNAIFYKVPVAGKTAELWIVRPDYIGPIMSEANYLEGYEYKLNGKKIFVPYENIIHFMFVDPATPWWGIAPMKAASKVVDTDIDSVNFNKIGLQNRGVPDGIIALNQNLTQDQFDSAKDSIREGYLGPDNAHTPLVLSGEARWQRTASTPAELDFIKSQSWTAERICAVFGVPPPLIGLYEKATLTNIETARLIFWQDTVVPYLDDLKDVLNHSLAYEYGENAEVVIDYDVSEVQALASVFNEKITSAVKLFQMGVPFNEINQRLSLDFDDIAGGDQGWIPSTFQPSDIIPDDFEPTE